MNQSQSKMRIHGKTKILTNLVMMKQKSPVAPVALLWNSPWLNQRRNENDAYFKMKHPIFKVDFYRWWLLVHFYRGRNHFWQYLHFTLRFTPLVSAYMAIIVCSDRADGETCFILQSFILTSQQWAVRKGMTRTPRPPYAPKVDRALGEGNVSVAHNRQKFNRN